MLAQEELLVVRRVEKVHSLFYFLARHDRVVVHRLEQGCVLPREVDEEFWTILTHQLLTLIAFDLPGVHWSLVGQSWLTDCHQDWVDKGLRLLLVLRG